MGNVVKPLTKYFEEHYKEEFDQLIQDNIPEDVNLRETVVYLVDKAYKEGFSDGASLGLWAKDLTE